MLTLMDMYQVAQSKFSCASCFQFLKANKMKFFIAISFALVELERCSSTLKSFIIPLMQMISQ